MPSCPETILAELSGEADDQRLLVVHLARPGQSVVELRQQTWAEKIGWFTQSSVQLSPAQLGALRLTLGSAPASATRRAPAAAAFRPRVLHADSA